jgi:hypothetical protein
MDGIDGRQSDAAYYRNVLAGARGTGCFDLSLLCRE